MNKDSQALIGSLDALKLTLARRQSERRAIEEDIQRLRATLGVLGSIAGDSDRTQPDEGGEHGE